MANLNNSYVTAALLQEIRLFRWIARIINSNLLRIPSRSCIARIFRGWSQVEVLMFSGQVEVRFTHFSSITRASLDDEGQDSLAPKRLVGGVGLEVAHVLAQRPLRHLRSITRIRTQLRAG